MSDNNIESTLIENREFPPSAEFAANATIKQAEFDALHKAAEDDYEGFWAKQANEMLDWHTPFTQTLDSSNPPFYKWFADGTLNVTYNCIDRHLADKANNTAIIFEGEKGDTRHYHLSATQ